MSYETFLEDSIDNWEFDFELTGRSYSSGLLDVLGDPKGNIADLFAIAPVDWLSAESTLGDVDATVKESAARLSAQYVEDEKTIASSSRQVFHGSSSFLPDDAVEGWSADLDRLIEDLDDSSKFWFRRNAERRPTGFEFTGTGGRWEYMVAAKNEHGWHPDGDPAPIFTGLVVGYYTAHAAKSRRLRIEKFKFNLLHHVPVEDIAGILLPQYPGLLPWQSFLRACIIEHEIDGVDWPPEWGEQRTSEIVEILKRTHRPFRAQADAVPGAIEIAELNEMLHPFKAAIGIAVADETAGDDSATVPVLPSPRLIKTARAAEEYAAEVMEAVGLQNVVVSATGADGGVDVWSDEAVAQVKMEGVATGRPVVQALFGVAALEDRAGIVFSLAGYTVGALDWAAKADVACLEFEFDGTVIPRSPAAERLLRLHSAG